MQNVLSEKIQWVDDQALAIQWVCIGKLVSVKESGLLLIDYCDNPFGPLAARSTICISVGDEGREVILIFEKNDKQLPIIIGLLQKQPIVKNHFKEVAMDKNRLRNITVDGERIIFDAKKEITFRCGKGSVTIQSDGKIVVKGTNLISRSKGMNKIKGAAVKIN